MSKCTYPGCTVDVAENIRINGCLFCGEHNLTILRVRFVDGYTSWKTGDEATEKLLKDFARFVDALYKGDIPGALSKYRVHARGKNFMKTEKGLTFDIIRHPGAWTSGGGTEVKQYYSYDFTEETLTLESEVDTGVKFTCISQC